MTITTHHKQTIHHVTSRRRNEHKIMRNNLYKYPMFLLNRIAVSHFKVKTVMWRVWRKWKEQLQKCISRKIAIMINLIVRLYQLSRKTKQKNNNIQIIRIKITRTLHLFLPYIFKWSCALREVCICTWRRERVFTGDLPLWYWNNYYKEPIICIAMA
jgi:hypothetical protein